MTVYVVNYDLIAPQKDYSALHSALTELGGHRVLDSFWLVNTQSAAKGLLEHLKLFTDGDDKLWVSELTRNHYFSNANGGTNAWLSSNPPDR